MQLPETQVLTELEAILDELETALPRCREGLLKSNELSQLLRESEARALAAVPPDSDAFRILDRAKRTVWAQVTPSGYAEPTECAQLQRQRELVRKALDRIEPEFLRTAGGPKQQYYFEAGELYRSFSIVYSILGSARSSVDIIDDYLDATAFDFIRSLEVTLTWRILTGRSKPILKHLLPATASEGYQVTARENKACHDRFIILDSGEAVWHLGASLNGIGKKAWMLNAVGPEESEKVIADFARWWADGTAIP